MREEDESEPDRGALHEEPCQWRRKIGTPSGTVVLAVGSLQESETDEGRRSDEEESEERVAEDTVVFHHGDFALFHLCTLYLRLLEYSGRVFMKLFLKSTLFHVILATAQSFSRIDLELLAY